MGPITSTEYISKVKASVENGTDIELIQTCGRECAEAHGAIAAMGNLRSLASEAGCVTDADYTAYLKEKMPVDMDIEPDGFIMRIGKTECTCPAERDIVRGKWLLCECTKRHEKVCWSSYFGKAVDVEIVESILRGGSDCVIRVIFPK